eukprot:5229033-Pleurochrysis_carterae.AAC.1
MRVRARVRCAVLRAASVVLCDVLDLECPPARTRTRVSACVRVAACVSACCRVRACARARPQPRVPPHTLRASARPYAPVRVRRLDLYELSCERRAAADARRLRRRVWAVLALGAVGNLREGGGGVRAWA